MALKSRCAAALLCLLTVLMLPAIGPSPAALPPAGDTLIVLPQAPNDELPPQRLAVLVAHRPQAPPTVIAAFSFSPLQAGALRTRGLVVVYGYDRALGRYRILRHGYVGSGDPVNRWDPSGLDWYKADAGDHFRWFPGSDQREGYSHIGPNLVLSVPASIGPRKGKGKVKVMGCLTQTVSLSAGNETGDFLEVTNGVSFDLPKNTYWSKTMTLYHPSRLDIYSDNNER